MKLHLPLAFVLLGLSFSLFAADKHSDHAKSPMAAMISNKSGAEFEAAYLGLMILHHQSGGKMWALAREKATNDTLKEMERKTTPKEQQEIEEMTRWLKQWHNKTPQDFQEPEESSKKMETDMAALRAASGKEFDALFAKKMAHHHMGAIEMGKLATDKAQHDEVKKSAREIVESQTKDREKLMRLADKTD